MYHRSDLKSDPWQDGVLPRRLINLVMHKAVSSKSIEIGPKQIVLAGWPPSTTLSQLGAAQGCGSERHKCIINRT